MKHLLLTFLVLFTSCLFGQDEGNGITIHPRITEKYNERMANGADKSVLNAVDLPFEDDFTQDHFIGNSDGNEVLWEDLNVYLNNSYGVNPPSVGVVTFDGLDATGFPYEGVNPNGLYGPADTLTSVEIDLSNTNGGLVLSFYYQPGGLGETPEGQDSLVLEFFNTSSDNWDWQWSIPGNSNATQFDQFLIAVEDSDYLVDDFQFRFRNYGNVQGVWDLWNLDYVRLDQNRTLSDSIPIDICFAEPIYTLLNDGYTSIPWSHYIVDPSSLMTETQDVLINNLRSQAALISGTGVKIEFNGMEQIDITDAQSPSIPPQAVQGITQEINTSPNDYFYEPSVNSISANFEVTFSLESSPDEIEENNEMTFTQRFQDYYDVSDGTAETAYGLDLNGIDPFVNVAYKVDALQSDSLEAIQISFFPSEDDSENGTINISVWEDDGFQGSPGTLLYQSEESETPDFTNTTNGFAVFPFENRIFVDESYYIGFRQSNSTGKVQVGIDKSRDNNTGRFFSQLSEDWTPIAIAGSALMRPQYISDIPVVGINEITGISNVVLWPNPANDFLSIQYDHSVTLDNVLIFDQLGKLISEQRINQNQIDTSVLPEGMYLVKLIGNKNNFSTTKKIVVTH